MTGAQQSINQRIQAALGKAGNPPQGGDSIWNGTAIGALLGGALPASSLADYEARLKPKYHRLIDDLVDQASDSGTLLATNSYDDTLHPLAKRVRLGDVISQSHKGERGLLKSLQELKPDFTSLSLGSTGSPIAHSAIMGVGPSGVYSVDAGNGDLQTPLENFWGRMKAKLTGEKWLGETADEVRAPRKLLEEGESISRFLDREGGFPFLSLDSDPNATVVARPKNLSGISDKALEKALAAEKFVPYGAERAGLGGLFRMSVPFADILGASNSQAADPPCHGPYCSDGVKRILQRMGHSMKPNILPADLLDAKNTDLVGIGLNQGAMQDPALKGLTGKAKKVEAAKKVMRDTMQSGSKYRRAIGGALAGLGALTGGVIGATADKASE